MTGNPHAERALVLMGQGRSDLALPEWQRALGEDPDDGWLHLGLARCLHLLDREREALAAAQEAVARLGDVAEAHRVLGDCRRDLGELEAARTALENARRLDPDDADVHGSLAELAVVRRDWLAAREHAETGLRLDPEHAVCSQLRAFALTQLGERELAMEEADAGLRRDPENAYAHAQRGWALLNQGRQREAAEAFREALRLEPGLEFARSGMIEALKARNPLYALFLRYFLFMGRLGGKAWIVLIGLLLVQGQLRSLAKSMPDWSWLFLTLYWTVFAFAIGTWVVSPLFNFTLWLHPLGRLALNPPEKRQSFALAGCLAAVGLLAGGAWGGLLPGWAAVVVMGCLSLPVVIAFDEGLRGWARGLLVAGIAVMVLLGGLWVQAERQAGRARAEVDRSLAAQGMSRELMQERMRLNLLGGLLAPPASATAPVSASGARPIPPVPGSSASRSAPGRSEEELVRLLVDGLPEGVQQRVRDQLAARHAVAARKDLFMLVWMVVMLGGMVLANGIGRRD